MKKKTVTLLRRGGRPSREQAAKIEDKILDTAAALFFEQGYGAVRIEEVVKLARVSKRTLYARYENKKALFTAVVHRIIYALRPPAVDTNALFQGKNIEEILHRIAPLILNAALSEEALSLHRLMLSEARRFPELALIMNEQSSRQEAIQRIASVLGKTTNGPSSLFAAEQFLYMLTAGPQRCALGIDKPMSKQQLTQWATQTVHLFLKGYAGES